MWLRYLRGEEAGLIARPWMRHADAAQDPARVSRHGLHGLALAFLQGDLRLGGGIQPRGFDPPLGQRGRVVGVNPDARYAQVMRVAEPRAV